MYGYIYFTTNLINGRGYIGKKRSSVFLEGYKGSGTALKESVKKYGKEKFYTQLICWCDSEEELNEMERYFIEATNADLDRRYYNITIGGLGLACRGEKNGMVKHPGLVAGEKNPMYGKGHLLAGGKNGAAEKTKVTMPDGEELLFDCSRDAYVYLFENYGISPSMSNAIKVKGIIWKPRKIKFKQFTGLKIEAV